MNLKQQLNRNLKRIKFRYACYVDTLRKRVIAQGVEVDELCGFIENLFDFDDDESEERQKILCIAREELKTAKTINNIFSSISKNCASFLEIDIFESIIRHYNIEKDCEDLNYANYAKCLREYVTATSNTITLCLQPDCLHCLSQSQWGMGAWPALYPGTIYVAN